MKTKLTFSELNTFKSMIPVSRDELNEFLGGGSGCGISSAYSLSEYRDIGNSFVRGWVRFDEDDVRYLTQPYSVYCGSSDYSGSDYSGSSDYCGSTDYSGSSEYSGSSCTYSYEETCLIISDLIAKLPEEARTLFQYIDAGYNNCIPSEGRYYPDEKTIFLNKLDYNTLFRECVHATQDIYGLGGNNHAAKEYQEHIIGDLEKYRQQIIKSEQNLANNTPGQGPRAEPGPLSGNYSTSQSKEFQDWIEECVDPITQEIDMTVFLPKANKFVSQFQSKFPENKGYQGYIPEDYDYNWVEILQHIGFKISK